MRVETTSFSISTRRLSRKAGAYDRLYDATDLLWPDTPGRMVVEAASRLTPSRALDLGCGDGKNLCYLARLGWTVDGIDLNKRALAGARRRLDEAGLPLQGVLACDDVVGLEWSEDAYDLVVAYGLLHCLTSDEASLVLAAAARALAPDGLLAVAAFDDRLPIPDSHGTTNLYLRPGDHVVGAASGTLEPVVVTHGTIQESHDPVIGVHQHAVTWALLRKPPRAA